jgi:hypothetical protein
MHRQLIASIDSASPAHTNRVEASLVSFRRIDPFKANLRRTDGTRVAINDSRHT